MAICQFCGKAFDSLAKGNRRSRAGTTCGAPDCVRARARQYKQRERARKRTHDPHAIRKCVVCGTPFEPRNSQQICCSASCGARRKAIKTRDSYAKTNGSNQKFADAKARKIEADMLKVKRDMDLPAAERYKAQKSWTREQRNFARRLYESRHGLFRSESSMWE